MEISPSVTNKCEVCSIEITGKGKTCSPRCRMILSRQRSVTRNGSVTAKKEPSVTFRFTVTYNRKPGDAGYDEEVDKARKKVRTAVYWYDVPLAATPVYEHDWPKMPESMNGRQYFLWWKNEFKNNDKDEPIILNPDSKYDNIRYEMGGESSRRWGA